MPLWHPVRRSLRRERRREWKRFLELPGGDNSHLASGLINDLIRRAGRKPCEMGSAAPRSVFVHRNPPNRSGINKPWWWFFDRNYPELNNSFLSLSWRCSGALDADAATPCTTLCPTRSASQPKNCSNYTTTPGSAWLGNLLHSPSPWKWNKQNTGECGIEQLLNKDEETDIRRKSTPVCEGGSENINFVKWIQILLYCHQYDWSVIQLHRKLQRFGRINGISMDKLVSE